MTFEEQKITLTCLKLMSKSPDDARRLIVVIDQLNDDKFMHFTSSYFMFLKKVLNIFI